jgi:outer membrane protein assembly factor BamB
MFQHDVAHTGCSSSTAPDVAETRFIVNYTLGHQSYASPIVIADRLIIPGGYSNFSIYCINATIGRLLWTASESFFSDATPATYANRIVIPSSSAPAGGYLYCFDSDNGTLVWKFYFTEGGYGNMPSPIIQDGVVFFSSGTTGVSQQRGNMFALSLFDMENVTTPKVIWKKSLNSIGTTSPAYSNGKILLGYTTYSESTSSVGDSYIVSLNATDGSLVWSYLVENVYYGLHSSPTVVDGKVFFGSYGTVYCLNESSGELLWNTVVGTTDIYASSAVADGKLFVGTLERKSPDVPAVFACLNASTGDLIWNNTLGYDETLPSSPAVADGKVFVSSTRRLYAFNATNGDTVWSFQTIGVSSAGPAVASGSVFLVDNKGYVYCFGPMLYFEITIDPIFYDNRGEVLNPSPEYWRIRFPNGTETIANASETYFGQMGYYSIAGVFWKGASVEWETTSTFLDSNMTWNPLVYCILPTELTISTICTTYFLGFQVRMEGNLTCNAVGIAGVQVLLLYSVTGGTSWNDIMLASTATNGHFSADWLPPATGNYIVRAVWTGNLTYPSAARTLHLSVTPYENQYVFTVESNSTISDLTFDSNSHRLSFVAYGENGTTGYTKVTIAKNLAPDITKLKVHLDKTEYEYTVMNMTDSWVLFFSYNHSIHQVEVDLGQTPIPEFPSVLIVALFMIGTILAVIAYKKKH